VISVLTETTEGDRLLTLETRMKKGSVAGKAGKIPRLTPELTHFIEGMGLYFASQGIPRIGGRILGLLMIAHGPLSPEEIAHSLKISRGSISTNFRLLMSSGMVEKTFMPGDRTTYYVFSDSAMEQRLAVGMRSAEAFKRLVLQGRDALPAGDAARRHLDNSLVWSDLLISSLDQAISQWRTAHTGIKGV
jgi:DNA-binding MarR family transcriptional regulator